MAGESSDEEIKVDGAVPSRSVNVGVTVAGSHRSESSGPCAFVAFTNTNGPAVPPRASEDPACSVGAIVSAMRESVGSDELDILEDWDAGEVGAENVSSPRIDLAEELMFVRSYAGEARIHAADSREERADPDHFDTARSTS